MSDRTETPTPEDVIAEALFTYNTPQAHHFVVRDGGYEGIALATITALHDAGYRIVSWADTRIERLP